MAKQSAERKRALALFNRRVRAAERKGFIFPDGFNGRNLSTYQLTHSQDYGLYKYATSFQLKGVDNELGDVISYADWKRYEAARLREQAAYRRNVPRVPPPEVRPEDWKPPKPRQPRLTVKTREGLERVIEGADKRSKQSYWDWRNQVFVDNYIKTLDLAYDQKAADAIREKIRSKPLSWAVRKLTQAQEGYLDIAPGALFDSYMGTGVDNMGQLLRFWEVNYTDEVEYEWVEGMLLED